MDCGAGMFVTILAFALHYEQCGPVPKKSMNDKQTSAVEGEDRRSSLKVSKGTVGCAKDWHFLESEPTLLDIRLPSSHVIDGMDCICSMHQIRIPTVSRREAKACLVP